MIRFDTNAISELWRLVPNPHLLVTTRDTCPFEPAGLSIVKPLGSSAVTHAPS